MILKTYDFRLLDYTEVLRSYRSIHKNFLSWISISVM